MQSVNEDKSIIPAGKEALYADTIKKLPERSLNIEPFILTYPITAFYFSN